MSVCEKCNRPFSKPEPAWYIYNWGFIYNQFDNKKECAMIYKAMKPKNDNLKIGYIADTRTAILGRVWPKGFNF